MQKVAEFNVELTGGKESLLNGIHVMDNRMAHNLDEKIFRRNIPADQQWAIICELRKMLSKMEHAYQDGRIERREVSPGELGNITSGASGVSGTSLGKLKQ